MTSAVRSRASGRSGPRTVAIVPAAGHGRRLGSRIKKPFVSLKGRPIAAHTIAAIESCPAVDEIFIACDRSCVKRFGKLVKKYGFSKVSGIVAGGRTRFESVRNCLNAIGPSFEIVIVHDGARPFIDAATVSESIALAEEHGACIVVSRMVDTVKRSCDGIFVKETLDRDKIFRAETPQAFRYEILKRAYEAAREADVTDDAGLVERLGIPVRICVGRRCNMKITTKEDLKLARALVQTG